MSQSLTASCRKDVDLAPGHKGVLYSLTELEKLGAGRVSRLPVSLRVVLESLLRNCDGERVSEEQVRALAAWKPNAERDSEIPFVVGRIVLNCAAGIPLLGDLAAMRGAVKKRGLAPDKVEPQVPVDMVLDHTLMVDYHGTKDALRLNMELECKRNAERFQFVKWAMQAYHGIRLIPPGFGILHQINLEFLAPGLLSANGAFYPDTLVGTDSHTGMISGLGTVGWGVGGIEAEAAALQQPVYILTPDVVGVHVTGKLNPGVMSTDLVLHVTDMLRKAKVVGKFVEFFGEGVANLTVPDRATISNMAPEYGATVGYFPIDEETCRYFLTTGRAPDRVKAVEAYFRAQGCFGSPKAGSIDYSTVLELDLSKIVANVAGPKRPQDRIPVTDLKNTFECVMTKGVGDGGYGKAKPEFRAGATDGARKAWDGDVVIAAITSCTNTSNPGVLLGAGLVARKAVQQGLKAKPWVKTSLTPGSMVVSKYLDATGLQKDLDTLGFNVAGYSCATCVGSSGPIDAGIEQSIGDNDVVACAVLSGNRNFEARIHPAVRAAFLASPPLVVAFSLSGTVDIDLTTEPLGTGADGKPVYLKDIWPTPEEMAAVLREASQPEHYRAVYTMDFSTANPFWGAIPSASGAIYPWEDSSTYIKEPPFVQQPDLLESSLREFKGARALAILGNSITTDHISPIGNIKSDSPAGLYLQNLGVKPVDFNNYGARRMNHEVMMRGTFANVRLKNAMVPGVEGGYTKHQPSGDKLPIYDAAMRYQKDGVPLFVIAGEEYGTGSARDWAAKGTRLLGVRAVVASSFERIHRSNLVGMGVLPCQLPAGTTAQTLGLNGEETFDLVGLSDAAKPGQPVTLVIHRKDGRTDKVDLKLRLDTPAEIAYVRRGGILPYMLNKMTA